MERESELRRRSIPLDITCFRTSIWDETLYKVRRNITECRARAVAFLQTRATFREFRVLILCGRACV